MQGLHGTIEGDRLKAAERAKTRLDNKDFVDHFDEEQIRHLRSSSACHNQQTKPSQRNLYRSKKSVRNYVRLCSLTASCRAATRTSGSATVGS